jgi:hypothetical protein
MRIMRSLSKKKNLTKAKKDQSMAQMVEHKALNSNSSVPKTEKETNLLAYLSPYVI